MVKAQQRLESQEEYNTKEKRTKITELFISNKNLEDSLDLSDFVNLEYLIVSRNELTSLALRNNNSLVNLDCSFNNLKELKINELPNLEELSCHYNQLTDLNLSLCDSLVKLSIAHNNLTSLNFLSNLPYPEKLTFLNISGNNISTDNLSFLDGFTNLKSLYISNTNINITLEDLENLPESLEWINYEGLEKEVIGKFKDKVVERYNVQKLKEIQTPKQIKELEQQSKEINDITPTQVWLDENYSKDVRSELKELDIRGKGLEGKLKLEDFTNLVSVDCSYNELSELDLSDCSKLEIVNCHKNKLTNLNLNNCLSLKDLNCYSNQLSSLDVSNFSQLKNLRCSDNQLVALNLGNNQLELLDCSDNKLSELDFLLLNVNKLMVLDISDNNFTTSYDLSTLSGFARLKSLWVGSEITSNDYHPFIGSLEALKDMKELEFLDISNTDIDKGGHVLLKLSNLRVINCSTESRVSSKVKSIIGELKKLIMELKKLEPKQLEERLREDQLNVSFEVYGEGAGTAKINKTILAQNLLDISYPKEKRSKIEELDFSLNFLRKKKMLTGKEILTGSLSLDGFYNLKSFSCADNLLEKLHVSQNKDLVDLDCFNNKPLKKLAITNTQLVSLNLKGCNNLSILRLDNNQLIDTEFLKELPNPENLKELYIFNNSFLPQDLSFLSKFKNLQKLDISGNKFYGSLKHLKHLDKLQLLNIKGTDIDDDSQDYLKLERFHKDDKHNKISIDEISIVIQNFNHDDYQKPSQKLFESWPQKQLQPQIEQPPK